MPCYHPLHGWRSKNVNPETGKRRIVFNRRNGLVDLPVVVPCGQCIGCRIDYYRSWAIRIMHEASLHKANCFITLTYDEDNMPRAKSLSPSLPSEMAPGTLVLQDFQKFMKRLRRGSAEHGSFKFFHCGEYGSLNARPHYHAALMGIDFKDKQLWKMTNGYPLFTSPTLEKHWPFGFSTVGALTYETAAYVSRYILKKVTGDAAPYHYDVVDVSTGEVLAERKPEYVTMSRGGRTGKGIASDWYDKYKTDLWRIEDGEIIGDFAVVDNRKLPVPKYYRQKFEIEHPVAMARLKGRKKEAMDQSEGFKTRLAVREKVAKGRHDLYRRDL